MVILRRLPPWTPARRDTEHHVTRHADDEDQWATCTCGWTSSHYSSDDVDTQVDKHEAMWA